MGGARARRSRVGVALYVCGVERSASSSSECKSAVVARPRGFESEEEGGYPRTGVRGQGLRTRERERGMASTHTLFIIGWANNSIHQETVHRHHGQLLSEHVK